MSDKYIIKNCPCYWHIGEDDGCSLENMKYCEDDTDCVLKQIVELCNKEIRQNVLTERKLFANELLELIDIQELNR